MEMLEYTSVENNADFLRDIIYNERNELAELHNEQFC